MGEQKLLPRSLQHTDRSRRLRQIQTPRSQRQIQMLRQGPLSINLACANAKPPEGVLQGQLDRRGSQGNDSFTHLLLYQRAVLPGAAAWWRQIRSRHTSSRVSNPPREGGFAPGQVHCQVLSEDRGILPSSTPIQTLCSASKTPKRLFLRRGCEVPFAAKGQERQPRQRAQAEARWQRRPFCTALYHPHPLHLCIRSTFSHLYVHTTSCVPHD